MLIIESNYYKHLAIPLVNSSQIRAFGWQALISVALTFQIKSDRPIAKKKIVFVFSEQLKLKAYYDKKYYPVEFFGMSNNRSTVHMPDVLKLLLQKYADYTAGALAVDYGG